MRRVWFVLLVLVPAPAVVFLAQEGYFSSSDGMIHLYRLFELDRALRAGILYPRWFPLSGYGYGLPVLNYYPPLSYYLAELFQLAGAGYISSIKLLIAFGFFAAACSMFLFARDLMGDAAAFVAGVGYAYLPYLLSDAYVRGNFPEFLAMAILPLPLWAFRRIFDFGVVAVSRVAAKSSSGRPAPDLGIAWAQRSRPATSVLLAALAFAVIILLHHLTAMLFAALLFAYIVFLFAVQRDWRSLLACAGAVLLALALSAFYWLPSIAELNLVYVGPASVARFLVNRLVSLTDFFAPLLVYDYLPQSEALKHAFGFPQTLLALLAGVIAIALLFRAGKTESPSRLAFHVLFFSLVVAASIFMTLTLSAPLWYAIPVLRFMQFPWRFQILAGIGIAFLLGVWVKWIADAIPKPNAATTVYALASLALIGLGIANLPVRTFSLTDADVNLLHSGDSDYVVAQMGWGWTREFVPATTQDFESIVAPVAMPNTPLPDHTSSLPVVQVQAEGLLSKALRVSTAKPIDVSLHTFFFPGWQAYVDGAPVQTFPRGSLGLASVTVPPGNHAVVFLFEDTPLRAASNWITILTALAGLAWLFVAHRRAAIALVGALVLLGALWAFHARTADAARQPTAMAGNLDDQALLVGYSTDRDDYRAGDAIYVTLYWLALNEMDKDYQVSVHLLGAGNETLAQHDGPPDQGLTPTTRWLPGEIVVDRHTVPLDSVAPGEYRLVTGMYLPLDNGYTNLGNLVELGQIQVHK